MAELAAIQLALSELQDDLAEQNRRMAEQNVLLAEQNKALEDVEERLPTFVPRSRFVGVVAIVAGGLGSILLAAVTAYLLTRGADQAEAERRRLDIASEQRRDRITAAARGYSNCTGINRALEAVDIGYSALAAQAHAEDETPEDHAATDRAHELLRSGLARGDCDSLLASLAPDEAAVVKAEASRTLPTLPLPPPPRLGPR